MKKFYVRQLPTKEELDEISQIVLSGHLNTAKDKINQYNVFLIGKSSSGYKFIFNHNDWKFYNSIEEMKSWLQKNQIEDQHGEMIKFEDFWTLVQECQKLENHFPPWCITKDNYQFLKYNEAY